MELFIIQVNVSEITDSSYNWWNSTYADEHRKILKINERLRLNSNFNFGQVTPKELFKTMRNNSRVANIFYHSEL